MEQQTAYEKLKPRQRRFVDLLIEHNMNRTAAARDLGYAAPDKAGYRLFKDESIRAAVEERLREMGAMAEEVIARLTQHSRGSMAPFVREGLNGQLEIDLSTSDARKSLHLVRKLKQKKRVLVNSDDEEERVLEIETEIELHDAQSATVHLGRYHNLFSGDAPDGSADKPFIVKVLKGVSMESI